MRRRRTRAEDRIRCVKDTGLRNLPLHDFDQNRIWLAIVALACDLLGWTAMLTLAKTTAVGTQAPAAATAVHRRTPGPRRPPRPAAPGRPRTLDTTAHRRARTPAQPPGRDLTQRPSPLPTTPRTTPAVEAGTTRATSGALSHPPRKISTHTRHHSAASPNTADP